MADVETAPPEPPASRLEKLAGWAGDAYGATKSGVAKGATYISPAASTALSTASTVTNYAVSGTVQAATAVGSASLNLAKKINENQTVAQVTEKAASAGKAGISVAQQAYNSPVTSQVLNKGYEAGRYAVETASAVASTGMDIGKKIYDHPQAGQILRFTGAAVGTVGVMKMWAYANSGRVGREVVRAGWVHTGIQMNNAIVSGLIPGLLTAWLVYDGYRLARWSYEQYYGSLQVKAAEPVYNQFSNSFLQIYGPLIVFAANPQQQGMNMKYYP